MEPGSLTTLTILPATCEHIELLLGFRRGMLRDMNKGNEDEIEALLTELRPWLLERLDNPEILFASIGYVDGVPITCAVAWIYDWYPGKKWGYIFSVYTHPNYRRRGFAGKIVQACVDWFREKGIRDIRLHASEYGQGVYAGVGFTSPQYPEMVLKL